MEEDADPVFVSAATRSPDVGVHLGVAGDAGTS
jgi:hypothetical protein